MLISLAPFGCNNLSPDPNKCSSSLDGEGSVGGIFKNWSSSSRCRRSIWFDRKLSLCDLVREIRDGQRPLLFARSEITIIVRGRRATGRFCGSRSVGVSTCSGRALHSLDFGYQVRVAPVGSPPEFPAGKLIVSSSPFCKLDRALLGVE